jgi:hypothetical protein
VTLASLWPILIVMTLGLPFLGKVPAPMPEAEFLSAQNRAKAEYVFGDRNAMLGYALQNSSPQGIAAIFNNRSDSIVSFVNQLKSDASLRTAVLGTDPGALEKWAIARGTDDQRLAVFGTREAMAEAMKELSSSGPPLLDFIDALKRNGLAAVQAILPLCLFLFLVLVLLLREKLPRADEIALGVVFGLVGMGFFNMGIELGLAKLGTQVGSKVPSSFKEIELTDEQKTIAGFDPDVVQKAVLSTGEKTLFFFTRLGNNFLQIPFRPQNYDSTTQRYTYTPTKGPLFGGEGSFWGVAVILLFAFVLGYGATLAEPALNALGLTVEELTVGTFKKPLLMNAVALGVGIGIAFGVAKIIWDIPLVYLLAPPYLILMFMTWASTEEFVNIGWDSAGVTTGPITVPLVLAMGLGVGGQMGVVEGFGILALASVWPIFTMLLVGLFVTRRRKAQVEESGDTVRQGGAA